MNNRIILSGTQHTYQQTKMWVGTVKQNRV